MGLIIDVRETVEFNDEHVPNSINIPLSKFDELAPGFFGRAKEQKIIFISRQDKRSKRALEMFSELEYSERFQASYYKGGLIHWKRAEKPTITKMEPRLSILRQVNIMAGATFFILSMMALVIHPRWAAVVAFMAALQVFDGIWGVSIAPALIKLLPWNRGEIEREQALYNLYPNVLPHFCTSNEAAKQKYKPRKYRSHKLNKIDHERRNDMVDNSPIYGIAGKGLK